MKMSMIFVPNFAQTPKTLVVIICWCLQLLLLLQHHSKREYKTGENFVDICGARVAGKGYFLLETRISSAAATAKEQQHWYNYISSPFLGEEKK